MAQVGLCTQHTANRCYNSLSGAAQRTCTERQAPKGYRHVSGWNKHVRESHRQARLKYQLWLLSNRPSSGPVYNDMCLSRKVFKSKLKWCQTHQEQIKFDILASHHNASNFNQFWKAINKFQIKPGLPMSVGGADEPLSIANMFVQHFKAESSFGPSRGMVDDGICGDTDLVRFSAKQVFDIIKKKYESKVSGSRRSQHRAPTVCRSSFA